MRNIIDLDPKLQRKLEAMAGARGRTLSELVAELLNRDPLAAVSPPMASRHRR